MRPFLLFSFVGAWLALLGGCAELVPVIAGPPQVVTAERPAVPMQILTTVAGGEDPLPTRGSRYVLTDLQLAIGRAVGQSTAAWADAHRQERNGGWQLQVELIRSHAASQRESLVVELDVRVTLRTVVGHIYLAQTQVRCRASGTDDTTEQAAQVAGRCVAQLGHDIGGWLDGAPR